MKPSPKRNLSGLLHGRRRRARTVRARIHEAQRNEGLDAALDIARDAVAKTSGDADIWYTFGRLLVLQERRDAASEAFGVALRARPHHLMALEYYLLTNADGPTGEPSRRAVHRLGESIGSNGSDSLGALDFLVPYAEEGALRRIATSRDPSAAAAAQFFLQPRTASDDDTGGGDVPPQLRLRVLLAADDVDGAAGLLPTVEPGDYPVDALRRAARRIIVGPLPESSLPLLEALRQVKPNDEWVRTNLAHVRFGGVSDAELVSEGFPFSPRAQTTQPAPDGKKALYLLHNSLPFHAAGYATRTHGLLSELTRRGWDVEGVTRLGYPYDMPGMDGLGGISSADVVDGVRYVRLSTRPGKEQKRPLHNYVQRYSEVLEQYARERRPFVLHAASNHWNGLAAVNVANRLGIPSVYEIRGLWEVTRASREPLWQDTDAFRLGAQMETAAASAASRVFTITAALSDEMVRRGVPEDKIRILPNGVDTTRFHPIGQDLTLRSELGLGDATVIGYVGSIVDYEGLGLLLSAAQILRRERNDFRILIVGDGTALPMLREAARQQGLDHCVIFTGSVPHDVVETYYSLIDIAPFPRLALPVCEMVSPLKPFEAMAMGKVVLASDVAALAEFVEDGRNGVLFTKGSVDDLTRQLRRLLDDELLLKRIGGAGLDWVRKNRDWTTIAEKVADTYEELALLTTPAQPGAAP